MKQPLVALTVALLCLLTGCTTSEDAGQTSSPATVETESQSQPAPGSQAQGGPSSSLSEPQGKEETSSVGQNLDRDAALQIALKNAGVEQQDAYRIKVQQDWENGIPIFDIEFETNYGDYDYEIALHSGDIVGADYEVEEEFLYTLGGSPVTAEEAKAIVQQKVPGAPLESIQIWEERDDGRRRYEGELYYQNMKYEFEIDPQTGILFDWNADFRG